MKIDIINNLVWEKGKEDDIISVKKYELYKYIFKMVILIDSWGMFGDKKKTLTCYISI